MNRYKALLEQYNRTRQQLEEHELIYTGITKGEAYRKRKAQLLDKGKGILKKMKEIGCHGNICHVQGKRSRPHAKNPRVQVQERFSIYFTNVAEDEVPALINLHIKNVVHHKVTFFRAGMLMVTS